MLAKFRTILLVVPMAAAACVTGNDTGPLPSASPASQGIGRSSGSKVVPNEYLVTLAPGSGSPLLEEAFGRFGIARIRELGGNVFLVSFDKDPGIEALERARAGEDRVVAVQPNYIYEASK
jgi:hypothetical protein